MLARKNPPSPDSQDADIHNFTNLRAKIEKSAALRADINGEREARVWEWARQRRELKIRLVTESEELQLATEGFYWE